MVRSGGQGGSVAPIGRRAGAQRLGGGRPVLFAGLLRGLLLLQVGGALRSLAFAAAELGQQGVLLALVLAQLRFGLGQRGLAGVHVQRLIGGDGRVFQRAAQRTGFAGAQGGAVGVQAADALFLRQQLAFVGDPAFQFGVALLAVLVLFAQARQFGVLLAEAVLLCVQFGGARAQGGGVLRELPPGVGLVLCAVVARARRGFGVQQGVVGGLAGAGVGVGGAPGGAVLLGVLVGGGVLRLPGVQLGGQAGQFGVVLGQLRLLPGVVVIVGIHCALRSSITQKA
jgi:hypothetical protein